uniref:Uncharacterized protein n=1 Tax=Pipistrellus kuhlii TaxID=59472 RepID=A0A7J7SEQ4_PIPKU|nr:hypothetical protein mPipKuh1_009999 [Pipistrellus kuhlii]
MGGRGKRGSSPVRGHRCPGERSRGPIPPGAGDTPASREENMKQPPSPRPPSRGAPTCGGLRSGRGTPPAPSPPAPAPATVSGRRQLGAGLAWGPSLPEPGPFSPVAVPCLGWAFVMLGPRILKLACPWLRVMKVQAVTGGHWDTRRGLGTEVLGLALREGAA